MTTLIERLETAEAGSRELDAEIAVFVGDVPEGTKFWKHEQFAGRYSPEAGIINECPAYISKPYDLTAAMTLVPEGWVVQYIMFDARGVMVRLHRSDQLRATASGAAPTPALALTAAALRAKEIEDEQP